MRFHSKRATKSVAAAVSRLSPLQALDAVTGKDNPALVALAFEVARSFPEGLLHRVFSAPTDRFHSVHSMLAITTYHYAIGFFGSDEIARRFNTEPPAAWPCPERPDGSSIRRFRNRNRLYVQQALERCLLDFCESVCADASAHVPHFLRVIKAEARMRVHQAELSDLESEF